MKRKSKFNIFQRILIESIWLCCRLVSIMPYWVRYYLLADIIYFIIYRCLRYRVSVVDKNLRNSFPELNDKERAKIRTRYYHYLTEVFISTISLAGGKPEKSIIPTETKGSSIERLYREVKGRSWITLTAHYGLWEYLMFWTHYSDQALIAVYHPLESPMFDELFGRLRRVRNVVTVPLKETVRFCLEHKDGIDGRNFILGLIADQNPPRRPNSHWFKFLNQDSIFFDGGEKIALKLKLPVYFVYQRRIKRGIYELDYKLIHDGVEPVEPYQITGRYVEALEEVIRQAPELWLWSHKRWKHDPKVFKPKVRR